MRPTPPSRPRLLITRKVFPEVVDHLSGAFDVEANTADEPWSREELLARVRDKDALFVVTSDRVDDALLAAAPRVRIVATGSVGFNHVDLAACKARGVAVTNTPDVLTEATADMGWALLMAAARRVCESERWLRDGQWNRWAWDQFLGQDVHGATLGIVGMGRIGSAIARRARGFGMRLLYCNRSAAANEAELGASRVPLADLLRQADHVMLVVPYSPQTHHLIGAAELALMKPTATLVNIARGGIVDDAALVEALARRPDRCSRPRCVRERAGDPSGAPCLPQSGDDAAHRERDPQLAGRDGRARRRQPDCARPGSAIADSRALTFGTR